MNKIKKSLIKIVVICSLVIAFIWGAGPYLAIAGKIFLATELARLIATLIVIMISIMSAIPFLIIRPEKKLSAFNATQSVLDQLHQRCRTAFTAIKRHLPHFSKRKQPWILLLGDKNAGKTTLLANGELTLHSPHQQSLSTIKNNQNIDWWIGDQAIFIDPAGKYCLPSAVESDDEKFWQCFLNNIKRKRGHQLFDQIVVVIDSPTLLTAEYDLNTFAEKIGHQLRLLTTYHRILPVTFVITQCDRLSGFLEFFADLGPEERNQSLGFTLTQNTDNLSIHELFLQRASAFIKRLGERLIWRLHHEQNLTRRARIKDFPWQMEQLNFALEKMLDKLPIDFPLQLQGVYYTSSLQSGNTINSLTKSIAGALHLIDIKTVSQPTRHKPYFVQALFQQLVSENPTATTKLFSHRWQQIVSYPAALAIIAAALFMWHQTYQKNVAALNIIQTHIATPSNEVPWLSQLNTLMQTIDALNQYGVARDRWLGFGQVVKLHDGLQTTYQRLLATNFVLYLDQVLTKQIQDDIDNNQPDLYNALQVYLMLIQPDHLNTTEITHWFKQLWANQYAGNPIEQQLLLAHLTNLLQLSHNSWPVNYDLIKNAQQVLQQRPVAQIAFMMLQTQYQQNNQPLLPNQTIPGFDLSHATIPALYSLDNFGNIYNNQIPQIAAQIERGNWVIGRTDAIMATNASVDSLTQKIRTLYLQNYVAAWQSALNQIQLIPPKTFSDAQNDIKILTDGQSTLWQILQKALDNSVIQNHVNDADINATGLLDLMSFIHQNDDYQHMHKSLQTLDQYIDHLTQSTQTTKLAYENAAKRMQNNGDDDPLTNTLLLAQKLPGPINQWLQTLSESVWQQVLDNSRDYIDSLWTTTVIPEYQNHIVNRYPIFKDGQQDISLNNFNHFFGPGGTVEAFFNAYLKPFVNTNQVYWTWKKINGKDLAIPQAKLDMLIRASMIQKMFYTDDPDSPSVEFTLTPISLSSNISRFILNVGGQMIEYEPGIKKTTHVAWPGNDGSFITMRFTTLNPQRPTTTMNGFWAWLHLLDQSQLQTTSDPKTFQITFILDGNQAVYQLIADNPVNPYQSQLLASFRCPDSL